MSSVDYAAFIEQLEDQKAAAVQEVVDLEELLEAVRKRATKGVTPLRRIKPALAKRIQRKPAAKKPAANGKPDGRSNLTEAQLTSMKTRWERGDSAQSIAEFVKVSDATVYNRAKAGGWKRPKPGAAAPAAAAPKKEPAGERLSGSVRCTNPKCGSWTDYDPCRSCGQKLKRSF